MTIHHHPPLCLAFHGSIQSTSHGIIVVRQRMRRVDGDPAEQLEVNVSAQLRLHLQEHQGHFPLQREEGLPFQLRLQALVHQSEALGHLVQQKEVLDPSMFTLFILTDNTLEKAPEGTFNALLATLQIQLINTPSIKTLSLQTNTIPFLLHLHIDTIWFIWRKGITATLLEIRPRA